MSKNTANPLICAIDIKDINEALDLCNKIKNHVGLFKLGLEFFTVNGVSGVQAVQKLGVPIFLDLKLHDIPHTVEQTVRGLVQLGVQMLTIHTSGGKKMLQAASNAARDEALKLGIKAPMMLGVTVLTSFDAADLAEIGVTKLLQNQVVDLAKLAQNAGLDGVICSPHEIEIIKQACGKNFKTIVPGIRPKGSDFGDQSRIMTPGQAIGLGADFIVVGRPITNAADAGAAAKAILDEM